MDENEKQELIEQLADGRENVNLLQNMLKKEKWNVEQELMLVDNAKQNLDKALYSLTGNEFYRNE
jgi:hypothetical protein